MPVSQLFLGNDKAKAVGYLGHARELLRHLKQDVGLYSDNIILQKRQIFRETYALIEIHVLVDRVTLVDKITIIANSSLLQTTGFGIYIYINGNAYPTQLDVVGGFGNNLSFDTTPTIVNHNILSEGNGFKFWMSGLTAPMIKAPTGYQKGLTKAVFKASGASSSGLKSLDLISLSDYIAEDLRINSLLYDRVTANTEGIATYSVSESKDDFYSLASTNILLSDHLFPVDGGETIEYDETSHIIPPPKTYKTTFRFDFNPLTIRVRLNNSFMTAGWSWKWINNVKVAIDQPFSTNIYLISEDRLMELNNTVNGKNIVLADDGTRNNPINDEVGTYYPQQGLINSPFFPETFSRSYKEKLNYLLFNVGSFGGVSATGDQDKEQNGTDLERRMFYAMQPYYFKASLSDFNKIYHTGAEDLVQTWIETSRASVNTEFSKLNNDYLLLTASHSDWSPDVKTHYDAITSSINSIQLTLTEIGTNPVGESVPLPVYSSVREGESSSRATPAKTEAQSIISSVKSLGTALRNHSISVATGGDTKTQKQQTLNGVKSEINTLTALSSSAITFELSMTRLLDDISERPLYNILLGQTVTSTDTKAEPIFVGNGESSKHLTKIEKTFIVPVANPDGTPVTGSTQNVEATVNEFNLQGFFVGATFNGQTPTIGDEQIAVSYERSVLPFHTEKFPEKSRFIDMDTTLNAGPFNNKGELMNNTTVHVATWNTRNMLVNHIVNYYDGTTRIDEITFSSPSQSGNIQKLEYIFPRYTVNFPAKRIYKINGSAYENPSANKEYFTDDIVSVLSHPEPAIMPLPGGAIVSTGFGDFKVRNSIVSGTHYEYPDPPVTHTHDLGNFRWIHSTTLDIGVNDRMQVTGGSADSLSFGFTNTRQLWADVSTHGIGGVFVGTYKVTGIDALPTWNGTVGDIYGMEDVPITEL